MAFCVSATFVENWLIMWWVSVFMRNWFLSSWFAYVHSNRGTGWVTLSSIPIPVESAKSLTLIGNQGRIVVFKKFLLVNFHLAWSSWFISIFIFLAVSGVEGWFLLVSFDPNIWSPVKLGVQTKIITGINIKLRVFCFSNRLPAKPDTRLFWYASKILITSLTIYIFHINSSN